MFFRVSLCYFLMMYLSIAAYVPLNRELVGNVIYFPKNNVIFLYIPKNGMTYVWRAFNENSGFINPKMISPEEVSRAVKLLVVRNPYDRVISGYFEILKDRQDSPDATFMDFFKNRDNLFESFHQFLLELEGDLFNEHVVTQREIFERKGFKLSDMDFIADLCSIETDLALFSLTFQVPLDLEHEDRNMSNPEKNRKLHEYVESSEEIRKLIEKIYAEDFTFYQEALQRREEILSGL